MEWSDILIQAIGFVSSAIFIFSYQIRSTKKLILAHLAASAIVAVHYFLLGQPVGGALNLVCALRSAICASRKPWARSGWTLAGLLVLSVGVGLISWQGWVSVLPIVGIITGTISIFTRNPRIFRLVQLTVTSPVWLIYNFLGGSIPGTLTDSFNIISIIVSLIRFGWKGLATAEAQPDGSPESSAPAEVGETPAKSDGNCAQTEM